jgi:hypothetical protein
MRRGVRVAEGARLESVCGGNSTAGSNPALSASFKVIFLSKYFKIKIGGRARWGDSGAL